MESNINLFVYGTLRDPIRWLFVSGYNNNHSPYTLKGYTIVQPQWAPYPMLVKGNGETAGVLYYNVTPHQVKRLDRYENGLYELAKVGRVSVYLPTEMYSNGYNGEEYATPTE